MTSSPLGISLPNWHSRCPLRGDNACKKLPHFPGDARVVGLTDNRLTSSLWPRRRFWRLRCCAYLHKVDGYVRGGRRTTNEVLAETRVSDLINSSPTVLRHFYRANLRTLGTREKGRAREEPHEKICFLSDTLHQPRTIILTSSFHECILSPPSLFALGAVASLWRPRVRQDLNVHVILCTRIHGPRAISHEFSSQIHILDVRICLKT